MTDTQPERPQGGCACGKVRYRLLADPVVVHCCHCRSCQRETGSAFALNALIETVHVELLGEAPERIDTPSDSGKGQAIMRCPTCKVAVWSHYGAAGEAASFVRAGTLDAPSAVRPGVHIYMQSKLPWVTVTDGAEQFEQFYSGKDVVRLYGEEGAARWKALRSA
ncbi:GFA family protein [Novosphingobium mangrovi (ex Huang et al. 2023)]|uniref:GFA family protein n=1 Tax=Novosphingobium mangrovi (ex Huang et al. 2023) TaxID=2976432 RepID=A0ABT2I823_9SPHN|nr:GFA family protein [Novosphingobium mangrovi (ex Huang et al. 2023)]MCT2400957.1 GFA family protein [Novosphingobium mangrovi (ex Huang et al. 2023)]